MADQITSTSSMKAQMSRRSLNIGEDGLSTSLRKSNKRTLPTAVTGDIVNDDEERIKRRSIIDIQRRLLNIPASPSEPETSQIGDKECNEHLRSVLRMHTDNKISIKNAWSLQIIDYMQKMLRGKGFGKDSLQVATTSLDAGVKVYSLRVDDLHAEGMKLASSMARADKQNKRHQGSADEDEGDDPGAEGDGAKPKTIKKAKKRFVRGVKNTIIKDYKTITGSFPKLESVAYQTRSDLENIGATSLMSLTLPVDFFGKMHLPDTEKPFSYDGPKESRQKVPFKVEETTIQICPQFSSFILDEYDTDNETSFIPEKEKTVLNEVAYDENGIPLPELDGSLHDIFGEPDHEPFYEEADRENVPDDIVIRSDTITDLTKFRPHMAGGAEDEYSYHTLLSNKFTNRVWAGPSHWKLKNIRRTTIKFSGKLEQQAHNITKKQKVVPNPIDFGNPLPQIDVTQALKARKTTLKANCNKITLPQNFSLEYTTIVGLMSRELEFDVSKIKGSEQIDYQVANPRDSPYCSQIFDENGNDSGCDAQHFEDAGGPFEEEFIHRQAPITGDNLVDAPELVTKNSIQYATKAKKMDMKKLKNVIWRSVISDETVPFDAVNEHEMHTKAAKPHMFSEILQNLPGRLNANMREELSTPLAFVALLHLANEYNLKFTPGADLKDFGIDQDTCM